MGSEAGEPADEGVAGQDLDGKVGGYHVGLDWTLRCKSSRNERVSRRIISRCDIKVRSAPPRPDNTGLPTRMPRPAPTCSIRIYRAVHPPSMTRFAPDM